MGKSCPRSQVQTRHSELCTCDRDSTIQTDLALLIRCLLFGKNKNQFVSCHWFVLTDIFLVNGDEPNLYLPKFARPLYFFFLSSNFCHLWN